MNLSFLHLLLSFHIQHPAHPFHLFCSCYIHLELFHNIKSKSFEIIFFKCFKWPINKVEISFISKMHVLAWIWLNLQYLGNIFLPLLLPKDTPYKPTSVKTLRMQMKMCVCIVHNIGALVAEQHKLKDRGFKFEDNGIVRRVDFMEKVFSPD